MSPETIQLLTSSDAVVGYLIGLVGLLVVAIVSMFRPRPVPVGGVVMAIAGVLAFDRIYRVPVELTVGIGLLIVAGMLPVRSVVGTMALSLPGAAALGYTFVDLNAPELIVLVVAGTTLLGALVVLFDDTHDDGTGITLMVITYGAVVVLVPDTDWVVLAFGAALPLILVGYPLRWARLGRPGALGATGLMLWMAGIGGIARPETVVVAAAVLGVLVADPVAHLLAHRIAKGPGVAQKPWMRVAMQIVIGLFLGLIVRSTSEIVVVTGAVLVALVVAERWAGATG